MLLLSTLESRNLEDLKRKIMEYLSDYIQASFTLPQNNDVLAFILGLQNRIRLVNIVYWEKEIVLSLKAIPSPVDKIQGQIEKLAGHLLETNRQQKPFIA